MAAVDALTPGVVRNESAHATAVQSLHLLTQCVTLPNKWLGGVTYYASVYPALYSVLCAAVAVVHSSTGGGAALDGELQTAARVALQHVGNVHPLVVQALETLATTPRTPTSGQAAAAVVRPLLYLTPYWSELQ